MENFFLDYALLSQANLILVFSGEKSYDCKHILPVGAYYEYQFKAVVCE